MYPVFLYGIYFYGEYMIKIYRDITTLSNNWFKTFMEIIMSNIIKFPSLAKVKSMLTMPLRHVAVDLEYVRNELNNRFCVSEICFWDIESNKRIFKTFIQPSENFLLSKRLQERGITSNHLLLAPTMAELDELLKSMLPSFMLVFWNEKTDLEHYPALKHYSYGTRCCMKRFADRFGAYDFDFGDHSFVKLEDAAGQAGFKLEHDESFHQASTDAKATSFIWNELNKESIPESQAMDLILRNDVYHLLEENLEDENTFDENEKPLPF